MLRSLRLSNSVAIAWVLLVLCTGAGVARAQTAVLSVTSGYMGQLLIGSSATANVVLSNTGTAALSISSIVASGPPFTQTNTCGTSVAAGGKCTIAIKFTPTVNGLVSGTVTVTDNSTSGSTQVVSLTGAGLPPAYLSAVSFGFGNQALNTTSAAKTVTVTNRQTTPLPVTVGITGDFAQTNTCGSAIPASGTCTVSMTFTPTATGTRTGTLTITPGVGPALTAGLSGTGTAAYTLTPASLAFGNQGIGTTSAAKTVTLTNTQPTPLGISNVTVSSPFAQTNNCGTTLAAGASCSFSVSFAPAAAGSVSGTLSFAVSSGASPQITLTGNGVVPYTVSASALAFGNQATGTTSAAKTVTLTNNQGIALGVSSVVISTGFAQTNTCDSSVAAGASCSFSVTFTPVAVGNAAGSLSFALSSGASPVSIALSGTGAASLTISATSMLFGPQAEGTTSGAQVLTLKNNQTVALSITSMVTTAPFAQTNTCGSSLAPGGSCKINVTFAPLATGLIKGSLTINDDAAGMPQTVIGLTGSGIAPMYLSAVAVSFGSQATGGVTAAKAVTLRNQSGVSYTITGIATTGDFTQTNNCPAALASGASCVVNVVFAPSAAGLRVGTMTVSNTSFSNPLTASLSGTGTKSSATLTAITLGTDAGYDTLNPPPRHHAVSLGQTAQYSAIGTFSDGTTQDVTKAVVWTSSIPSVVAISNTAPNQGLARSLAQGAVTITATSGSIQASDILEVFPPSVTSAVVTPANATMSAGTTQQFLLTATYTDGTTKAVGATWSATGLTITTGGVATATSLGTGTVTGYVWNCTPAGCGSVGQTVNVTINGPQLAAMPTSEDFGLLHKGTLSAARRVTLTNAGATGLAIQLAVSSGFQLTNYCTGAIPGNQSCSVDVTFAPAAGGAGNVPYSGVLTITPSSGAPVNVTLTGVGTDSTPPCPTPTVDMKLLVINNAANNYFDFAAIQQVLGYVGTPYDVADVSTGVTASMLSNGCHGYYQGVIFAVGDDIDRLPGMSYLTTYEQNFGIRQVNWYTFPSLEVGLNPLNGVMDSGTTFTGNFTAAGAAVFSYANTSGPLTFTRAYTYLATPATVTAGSVTPLLTDNAGNALSLIYDMGDGRQYLTQTFDSNNTVTHDLVLAYGLINWVTKGLFLGEYHVYAVPQVDDIFMHNDEWESDTPCPNSNALPQFRLSAGDWDNVVAWQSAKQQNAQFLNWTVQMAFVGSGATGTPGVGYGVSPDTLTPEVELYKSNFNWISHTWDHTHLDDATAALTDSELLQNNAMAASLGLPGYNPALLVTPAITGLNNPAFINEAVADGVRVIVTDTTVLNTPNNGPNPSPNVGIVNTYNPNLYEVPRHATNLFYNVSTPDDWTAEYHCIYNQVPYNTYTYQQIVNDVSSTLLYNMLTGDMDPQMFHESNLHNYDGLGHSLLFDVYDQTLNNYLSLYKLPVLSPTLDVLAQKMQSRNQYNLSGVSASITGGTAPAINITVPSTATVPSAVIPVTGLNSTGAEVYGGQNISHVSVNAGQTVTLPVQ